MNRITTDCLFVCFDAGETNLLPVMKKMEKKGLDFRVLVMGTAASVVTGFEGKRLELKELGFSQEVTKETPRKTTLVGLETIRDQIDPKVVVVGIASQGIQKQMLKLFSDKQTVAYCDNFYYDLSSESGKVVKKVVASADHVFCPSSNLVDLFRKRFNHSDMPEKNYSIIGKPSLETWSKEISKVDKNEVYQALNLKKDGGPVVVLIGGYGVGYDIVDPLYEKCKETLEGQGYQVVHQPHPKISKPVVPTTSALAIADYVVGFNSSVLFDSLLIGKKAVYMIPPGTSYNHFAIDNGYAPKVENEKELLAKLEELKSDTSNRNIAEELQIPQKSTKFIFKQIEKLCKTCLHI